MPSIILFIITSFVMKKVELRDTGIYSSSLVDWIFWLQTFLGLQAPVNLYPDSFKVENE